MIIRKDKPKVARGATLFTRKIGTANSKSEKKQDFKKNDKEKSVGKRPNSLIVLEIKDENYIQNVIDFITSKNLDLSSYKEKYIVRRLRGRITRLKLGSYKLYLEYLKKNSGEIMILKETLSINVTRFFRNKDTFDIIQKKIMPTLSVNASKDGRKEVRIWSAGCAVGAEAYSLAMLAKDSLVPQYNVNIIATDLKLELLQIAQNGVYSEAYLGEMEGKQILKYFLKVENSYEVKGSIKQLVNFKQHDLINDPYPQNLDLIVCRNVLIYIDRVAQNKIFQNFHKSLRPGGIMILGRTEAMFGHDQNLKQIDIKHRIYRKKW